MKRLLSCVAAVAALLIATPAAAQAPPDSDDIVSALRDMVEQLRERMFAPGAYVEGWDRGGADPDTELRRAGADRHFFLIGASDGASVVILTQRPLADFAPARWRVVDSYGSAANPLANPFLQFTRLTPRYALGARASSRRRGDADCVDPIENAILYEIPGARATAEDEDLPLYFRIALLAGGNQVVCTRYDCDGSGWRSRAFTPEGRALPQLDDAEELMTIVPAAPLDNLLAANDASRS